MKYETLNHLLSKIFKYSDDKFSELPDTFRHNELWWDGRLQWVDNQDWPAWDDLRTELRQVLSSLDLPLDEFVSIGINLEGTLNMEIMASSNRYKDYIFKVERLNNYEKLIRLGGNFE